MAIEPLDNGSYRYVYTDQNGKQIRYARQEIWHLRGLSDDGYMGLSPIGWRARPSAKGWPSSPTHAVLRQRREAGGRLDRVSGPVRHERGEEEVPRGWQELQGGGTAARWRCSSVA
jgi:hypothetical protein